MEWKIYEEWLDITLYRQMTNLIYKLSSNEEKYKIYMQLKENDMFLEKPKVDMETAYGLHYPGEVLERIGEHLTLTKQTYRALGLALARMMPLQETCMFNGTQMDLFWKKMKQILGEKDLFLLSINLILSRLVDTFFSRISPTMQLPPKHHSIAYVLPWAEGLHWQSRSSGCSNS